VRLDDPVTAFYNPSSPPAFAIQNPFAGGDLRGVNLHTLSMHAAGLPREPPGGIAGLDENTIFQYLSAIALDNPPYVEQHYSNLGVALLGRCLERALSNKAATKISYEDAVAKAILAPLGMANSGFNYTSDVVSRMAVGYTINNGVQVEDALFAKSLGWSAPAGGIYSTLDDMLTFISRIFGGDRGSGAISEDAIREYMLPGRNLPDGVSSFGLGGFETVYNQGLWMLTKGGLVGGFGTSVVIVPELRLGVVCWVNLQSGAIPGNIASFARASFLCSSTKSRRGSQSTPCRPDTASGSASTASTACRTSKSPRRPKRQPQDCSTAAFSATLSRGSGLQRTTLSAAQRSGSRSCPTLGRTRALRSI
jgi:CubicO group peptidase (beta-lactamase class C family)